VAAAAEVGTSDSASDVPTSPSGWWKPRGKGQTYAYYMHIIYNQFYEVGPPYKYKYIYNYIAYTYIYIWFDIRTCLESCKISQNSPAINLVNAKQC
jgi:hypothetical protein